MVSARSIRPTARGDWRQVEDTFVLPDLHTGGVERDATVVVERWTVGTEEESGRLLGLDAHRDL